MKVFQIRRSKTVSRQGYDLTDIEKNLVRAIRKSQTNIICLHADLTLIQSKKVAAHPIKAILRKLKARTTKELEEAIAIGLDAIIPKDAIGWFTSHVAMKPNLF